MTRTENTDKNLADNGIDSLSDPLNRGETPEMAETASKAEPAGTSETIFTEPMLPAVRHLGIWRWLVNGCRCAFFLKPEVQNAQPTPWQTILLALLSSLFVVGLERLMISGPATFLWDSWVYSWWMFPMLVWLNWAALYADVKIHRHNRKPVLQGLVSWIVLSLWVSAPAALVGYAVNSLIVHQWLMLPRQWMMWFSWGLYIFIMVWWIVALSKLSCRYLVSRGVASGFVALTVALSVYGQMEFRQTYWVPDYSDSKETFAQLHLSQQVFEEQQSLWKKQTEALLPERKDVIDVYALVFAPYAREEVFRRESTMVTDVLRQHFDADGRILHLLNHAETSDTLPWATPENLQRGIDALAARMDRERDVLIIYMTSHGAKSFKLSANNWPLEVPPVTPELLRKALDNAGIQNRVLFISACYSGGWITPLETQASLVMSASAADKTSYGCGSRSELTYFGRAMFDEQLRKTHSFKAAFDQARIDIEKREVEAGKEGGFSDPQIYIGPDIVPVLKELETRLDSAKNRDS